MIVPKRPFAFHYDSWTGPPQATAGPYAHPMCAGRRSVARLHDHTPGCLATRIPTLRIK
jgi:hypothetical protein